MIRVSAKHLKAESCPPILEPIPGFEQDIVDFETSIVQETIVLATKWESYWTDLKTNSTNTRDPLQTDYDNAEADLDDLA